jgi:hypothetical protein
MVLLVWCFEGFGVMPASQGNVHGDRKHLTCRLCGISGDYSVCFEGYTCCEACEESGRVQHGAK